MSITLRTMLAKSLHYFLSMQHIDRNCKLLAEEINEALAGQDGLTIRLSSQPGVIFEVEQLSGHSTYLSANPETCCAQLQSILVALSSTARKRLSLDDFRAETKIGTDANPTQYQVDKIKRYTPGPTGKAREVKPKLTLDDLLENLE